MVGHRKDTVKSTWQTGVGADCVVTPVQLIAESSGVPPTPQVRKFFAKHRKEFVTNHPPFALCACSKPETVI